MIYLWVSLVLGAIWADRLHRSTVETKILRSKYRMYKLRDDLREAAMRGEVEPNNWVFLYLDSSITKTTSILDKLTFWKAVKLTLVHSDDARLERARVHLARELSKPKNALLAEFHERYGYVLLQFLTERHPTMRLCTRSLIRAIVIGARVQDWIKNTIRALTALPESSTLQDYLTRA